MKLENFINEVFLRFPELNEFSEDDIEDMPHYVCESIFYKYVAKICKNFDIKKINEICLFIEEMAVCNDERISDDLLGVSIIEPLLYDTETLRILRKHLKEKTLHELELMENWKPEVKMTSQELYDAINKKSKK